MYTELLLISYYNTGIEDLIVEILEDIVIINWTPLNYTELTLEYKQTNEQRFQCIIFPVSVVSTGLPRLQHDIEYVFQVYGVFTINNVKYESERSPPVTIMITIDRSSTTSSSPSLISSSDDSQIGFTGLVAGVSVLSIIVIILLVVIIIFIVITVILFKILIKKPKEKERFSVISMNYILLFLDSQLNLLVMLLFMKIQS